jgi:hypothetical protein
VTVDAVCAARTGYLEARTLTKGADSSTEGFRVQVDSVQRAIPATGAVALLSPPGEHQVLLEVLPECTVEGANPQTVTIAADDAVRLTFVVTCADPN